MNAPLKKLSQLTGVAFDGVRTGYVPPKKLSISPKLRVHRKAKASLDPVTFGVVRHALWNVNEEHGATIQRLSGSGQASVRLLDGTVHRAELHGYEAHGIGGREMKITFPLLD